MESNERDKGKVVGEKEAKQDADSDKKDPLKMGTLELTGWWAGQATDEEVAALSGRQICRMTYQMINDECTPLPLPHALKRIIYEMTEERRENDPEMTVKDWVWLVCLLAECSPSVPKDVLDGWFDRKKGKTEDKEEKPIPPKPKSRRDPDQQICPMTAMLPRLNKIHMTESDLFTKVVCKFWPPDAIDAAVKKLRHGAFDTSLYKTGLSEAEYPLVFFSIDWTVTRISYDANSAIAMVATSLACIATAIEKCSDEELSKVIRIYCDVSERTTYTFQAALISDEEPIKLILTAHRKLLMDARKRKKILIEIANLNFKTAIFLKISPFLQVEILGETMWQVVKDLIEEFLKDVNEQQNPPSALAIPEYDEDDDDLGETEWIDQIIRRVPAALDERNAKKSEMGNHLQKLTRLIIHYIELGKIAKSGHQMLSLIERFYLKVCSDADCPSLIEHMEKTYAELCRRNLVPLDMQERILSDLLGEELMNSSRTNFCDLVTALIGFAHQDSRPKLAQLVLDKYFEDLAVKRIKMNMASLHIERTVIRFVGKEYAAKMARNIIYFLAPKELGDDETELSYKLLLVIFDSLISGGGENSCRLECFNLIGLTGQTFEHLLFTSQLLRDFQKSTVRLQYMEFYGHTPEAQNTANDLAMRHVIVKQITDCIDGMKTALRKGTWREHERAMSTTVSSWMSAILADNKPIRAPLMQFTKDIVNQIVIETAGQSHPSAACLIGTTTAPFDRLCAFTQIDHGAIIHEIIRDKRIEEFEAFYGLDSGKLERK
ncbi:hypothetical protein WR25_13939 [Diploscapter pachys]|uniref:Uncharacterized protein n=1 Tax=Diploscapter pachys TaxID=2018661 RepID=A0A2A2L629_9BILA|nr:hypothetical protein WR25_13939 [Diploscapter pachys]